MTDFQINDHILTKECESLAKNIFDDIMRDAAADETGDDYLDDMMDRAHETSDGHEWVIYHYKALMACAHCNVDRGEELLEETRMPETPTINSLASLVLYGEIRLRIEDSLADIIREREAA